jgi:hypothetical protein
MKSSKLTPLLAAASFAAIPAGPVAAQKVEQVPNDVVAALFSWVDVDILVGRLPDGWPTDFPFPEGARVLGSYQTADILTVALAVEGRATAAREALAAGVSALGWTREPAYVPVGFVWMESSESATLCRGDDRLVIHPLSLTRHNVVRMHWYAGMRCTPKADAQAEDAIAMPTLVGPAGTEMTGLASSHGFGVRGVSATLRANAPLETIVADYVEQLLAQGWSEVAREAGPEGVIVSVQRDGVRGALTAVRVFPRDYLFEFRVVDTPPSPCAAPCTAR